VQLVLGRRLTQEALGHDHALLMLSGDAKKECLTIFLIGVMLGVAAGLLGWWIAVILIALAVIALLSFFRDPDRRIPNHRAVAVAPSDGTISSVHELEHFEPFDGPAVCVRIFMSVFNVHINRVPCHGKVASITHQPGKHGNTLNPQSAEDNESMTTLLVHPLKGHPVAAVRQIAGLLARTIYCRLEENKVVQRGQRMGIIKLGSTTELYLPQNLKPVIKVRKGQKVLGGITVLAAVTPLDSRPTDENPIESEKSDSVFA
jgi:phosphatidylserine decarboxylase